MAKKIPTRKAYQPDIVQTAGRKVKMDSSIEKTPSSRLSPSTNSKGAKTKEHLSDPVTNAFTNTMIDQVPGSIYAKTYSDIKDTSWNNNTLKALNVSANFSKRNANIGQDLLINLSQEILKSIDETMPKQKNTYGRKVMASSPLKKDKKGNSILPFISKEYDY
jgi:hypothetical protein